MRQRSRPCNKFCVTASFKLDPLNGLRIQSQIDLRPFLNFLLIHINIHRDHFLAKILFTDRLYVIVRFLYYSFI